jgi:hypothetical protein
MLHLLTKTDFLISKGCNKNAWLKVHKPDIYHTKELSAFELNVIDTGNEIDALARDLFPDGVLVEDRHDATLTQELIANRTPVIYQPVFITDQYSAIADIIVWNNATEVYDLYEVKSSTATHEGEGGRRAEEYKNDVAFQKVVMDMLSIPVGKLNLVRLDKSYVRSGDLSIEDLFIIKDITEDVEEIVSDIEGQMAGVHEYINREQEPVGHCDCWMKSKSNHCTTFWYSNPDIPDYSVHQISRIGNSPKKLTTLVESEIIDIHNVPLDFKLSDNQRRQVDVAQSGKTVIDSEGVDTFLERLEYPLAFIDYETFPSAVPRYSGYHPYQQIPFQFSLHIIQEEGDEMTHAEFLHTENSNPDEKFIEAIKEHLPPTGTVLVWSQKFEKGINNQVAERLPQYQEFITSVQDRIVDLIEPFDGKTAVYWDPAFLGKSSIKFVLPALVPELSYKELDIQEGGAATDAWNRIVSGEYSEEEANQKRVALLKYCHLDTLAMVEIYKKLKEV